MFEAKSGPASGAWLLRDGEVLAALEIAESFWSRHRGLMGRKDLRGALLLRPARAVHSIGIGFPVDVAFCDRSLVVLGTVRMRPQRLCLPRLRAHCVVEAEAGAFDRWHLRPGDQLEIKG